MNEIYHNFTAGFRFESPWYLLLLILLSLIIYLSLKRRMPSIRIPWLKPFTDTLQSRRKFTPVYFGLISYSIGFILLVIALARPQFGIEQLIQRAEGIDMMLLMDLSGSMQAYDISPDMNSSQIQSGLENGSIKQRMDYAKDQISNFIKKRPNDRIGLVVFAPKSYLAAPPTLDHTFLLSHIDNVTSGIVGDSTNIAAPIATAVNSLKDAPSKRRVIVLFTDGSNNVNDRISPLQAAKLAKTFNIVIYTVGIGSNTAFVFQNSPFGAQFLPVYGQFDEKLLTEIAAMTGGKYFRANDAEGLKTVLNEINKLEKTTITSPRFVDYSEYGPKLVILALIFLILGVILESVFFPRIP
ncbi:MAG TPA: aerotolerance regulator BatA [Lentisphaeria bacterium]|nr:MAG: hypothetical protein A2X47_03445 [Lentisphaerae bacterium GWF2_38_69]HBM15265.1 aerotolerance regulator BatA [Lentisphaeria bacterium]